MKEEHRDLLTAHRRDIIREIVDAKCLNDILDELRTKDQHGDNGLTPENIDEIKGGAHTTAARQVGTFLDILPTRGENAFERFKQALIKTNQVGLISILNSVSRGASSVASDQSIQDIQKSLREMYSEIFQYAHPLSIPFAFHTENNWIPLEFKLENESTPTEDHIDLINKVFNKKKMLILEGDPGIGKTSLLRRIAYEWGQKKAKLNTDAGTLSFLSRIIYGWAQNKAELIHYDLVLYAEFRNTREEKFKNIFDLVKHDLASHLEDQDYKRFENFINNANNIKEHKILVLLDGYDESSLKEQCKQLTDYLYSTTASRPLLFNVLITSRKGYLSELRNQKGRFIFGDINGFTTTEQKEQYISKYFAADNCAISTKMISDVQNLLDSNDNLQRLSETPLLLTFICLVHDKIKEGTEIELYMNIIWWLLDRHQRDFPDRDIPGLLGFEYNKTEDKIRVIENSYQHFPELHVLGRMAMEDIFKSSFTETDLEKFKINPIIHQVGFLRKEEKRDAYFRIITEYSFPHRSIQEFIVAHTFFFSKDEPSDTFLWLIFDFGKLIGLGIVQTKIEKFLKMIPLSKLHINETRKSLFQQLMKQHRTFDELSYTRADINSIIEKALNDSNFQLITGKRSHISHSLQNTIELQKEAASRGVASAQCILGIMYWSGRVIEKSDEKALKWLKMAAEQGYANAQTILAVIHMFGIGVLQSHEEAVKWYTKAAEQGNADGQNSLGDMYYNGRGVDKSYEEAVKWYTKAAEQGDARGQNSLGAMYGNGRGVEKSYEEAVKWHSKAAEQGNAYGQNSLANKYYHGEGVQRSYEEAARWYRKAAEQGYAQGQNNLGWMYKNGFGVDKSYEEAVKWYTKAAEQGDAQGQNSLGFMYHYGRGVEKSYDEAVKWYRKAAEQGDAGGQIRLGDMYENGRGVEKSYEEAVKWYTKAADEGYARGQISLGIMYYYGRGVVKSDEEAVKWYRRAAEQGDAQGQNSLGVLYYYGRGVEKSYDEAVKWYRKAAEQGCASGHNWLGYMYQNGWGVEKSYEEAVKWYTKAAEQDDADGQTNLGDMYQNGWGVNKSYEEAVKWFRKAAEQGNKNGQCLLGEMYERGQGVPQSYKEAEQLYKKAEDQGEPYGQNNLKILYDKMNGVVPESDEEAFLSYEKSAKQNNSDAQCKLGHMYRYERGVPQSKEEAIKWYRRAAEQGNAYGQYNLAYMYHYGLGISQSDKGAVEWYKKAAKQGHSYAKEKLKILKGE